MARCVNIVERFEKIVSRIVKIGVIIGAVFLLAAMLLMVSNIIYRFLGGAVKGTYELVGPFISVTAAFALGYTGLKKGHVIMDMVYKRLPKRAQALAYILTSTLSAAFCGVLIWKSAELAKDKFLLNEVSTWLKVPIFPFRSFWVLGLTLFCLVFVIDLLMGLRRLGGK